MNSFSRCLQGRSWFAFALSALVAGLLIAGDGAQAQTGAPVGNLVLAKGLVKIRDGSGRETVHRDIGRRVPVRAGNVVQSGRDTRAKIFFRDEREVISLYSNTHFKITELTPRKSGFGLSLGKAFFAALAGVRNNTFQVRTPTATIGIKGTEFVAGTDGSDTFLLTVEGVVAISNSDIPETEVAVGANQASVVRANEEPSPAQDIEPEQVEQIVTGDDNTGFEDLGLPPGGEGPAAGSGDGQASDALELANDVTETIDDGGGNPPGAPSVDTPDTPQTPDEPATSGPIDISVTR